MHTWLQQSTRLAEINVIAILVLGVGKENLGHLRAAAVEEADIADTLHDLAGRLLGENLERCVPRAAFPNPGGDLDQFMIGEGAIQFLHDVWGQAGISQHDDGAQRVAQTAQMFLLFLGECHPTIIVIPQNAQAF
jgi:hypothetical protein